MLGARERVRDPSVGLRYASGQRPPSREGSEVTTMIEITEVRVSLRSDDKLKAFVSITLNDSFVVRGLKIIKGNTSLFVAMPSRKRPDGQHQDLAHPINDVTRKYLTERVMAEYERELRHPSPVSQAAVEAERQLY
jgi:stage V sporulation protein G